MISRLRAIEIRSLARDKLVEHDNMNLPVRPKRFAEKLNIVVQSFNPPQPDISGFLMQAGNFFGIGYSKSIKSEGFQNFTVAHELGHYFIDDHPMALLKDGKHFSRSGYISKDRFEREADTFATEFLMPWKLIEPLIKQKRPGLGTIKSLADSCESSLLASAIRYTEVTSECVAVVVSHCGSIEFMTASESFRQIPGIEWLRSGDPVPEGTSSYRLGQDAAWVQSSLNAEEGSYLSDWFSSAPRLEVEEDVVGLGSYQRLLTILITEWTEEEEERDDSEDEDYINRWKEGRFRKK